MTVLTTFGGQVNLLAPDPGNIYFEYIAEVLGKIPRFNGWTEGAPYSVAQHCVMGADAILREGQPDSAVIARHFLLHDAHEAFIGDIATPVEDALEWSVNEGAGVPRRPSLLRIGDFAPRVDALKQRLDAAIYAAAGADLPLPGAVYAVKRWDLRMLAAERRDLMPPGPPWPCLSGVSPAPLRGVIKPWNWHAAGQEWLGRYQTLFSENRRTA